MKLYMKTGIRKFARKSGILRLLPGDFEHLDDSLPSMSDQFFSAKGQVIRARAAFHEGKSPYWLAASCR